MTKLEFRSNRTIAVVVGAIATAFALLFFLLLFWNRFLGLRSGDGGFSGGILFLNNVLPYRDLYSPGPPLYAMRSAALLAFFGKKLIVLRAAGLCERLLLSLLLYGWLVRLFRVRNAAIASIVTMVVSSGDLSDALSSYNHFTVLLAVASGLIASFALDEDRAVRSLAILGAFAGIFASLSFTCKQTIGIGIVFVIPVVVGACLIRIEEIRKAAMFVAGFLAGSLVPLVMLLGWLVHVGAFQSFLNQIFVAGPAAKASHPGAYLNHALLLARTSWEQPAIGAVLLLLAWFAMRKVISGNRASDDAGPTTLLLIVGVLAFSLAVMGLAYLVQLRLTRPELLIKASHVATFGNNLLKPFVYLTLAGSGLLSALLAWKCFTGALVRRHAQFFLFASVSFAVAFMLSLSFPVLMVMMVPGLGLIVAAAIEGVAGWQRWVVCVVCGVLLFAETEAKIFDPFDFDGWPEPPATLSDTKSSLPVLDGLILSPNTAQFVDNTIRLIGKYSTSSDTIFVYPEFSFLYGATNRRPATYSGSHNIDVVSDAFAKEEAARLLRARPAVLVCGQVSESFLLWNEGFWRGGGPSGQRDLIAAVQQLMNEYHLAASFRLSGWPLRVRLCASAGRIFAKMTRA